MKAEDIVNMIIKDEKAEALTAINDLIRQKIEEDEDFQKLRDEMDKYSSHNIEDETHTQEEDEDESSNSSEEGDNPTQEEDEK